MSGNFCIDADGGGVGWGHQIGTGQGTLGRGARYLAGLMRDGWWVVDKPPIGSLFALHVFCCHATIVPLDVLKSIVICEIFFQERAEVEERLPAPRTTSNVALPPLIHSELQVEMLFLSYSP